MNPLYFYLSISTIFYFKRVEKCNRLESGNISFFSVPRHFFSSPSLQTSTNQSSPVEPSHKKQIRRKPPKHPMKINVMLHILSFFSDKKIFKRTPEAFSTQLLLCNKQHHTKKNTTHHPITSPYFEKKNGRVKKWIAFCCIACLPNKHAIFHCTGASLCACYLHYYYYRRGNPKKLKFFE